MTPTRRTSLESLDASARVRAILYTLLSMIGSCRPSGLLWGRAEGLQLLLL
jgi:hypothetical protein